MTADNSAGQSVDSGRTVRFATDAAGAQRAARAWRPASAATPSSSNGFPSRRATPPRWRSLLDELCADGPPKQDGIAPGSRKVYYLITDRGFSERGLRTMRVFGPRDAEFK